jgi:hypothetical protein
METSSSTVTYIQVTYIQDMHANIKNRLTFDGQGFMGTTPYNRTAVCMPIHEIASHALTTTLCHTKTYADPCYDFFQYYEYDTIRVQTRACTCAYNHSVPPKLHAKACKSSGPSRLCTNTYTHTYAHTHTPHTHTHTPTHTHSYTHILTHACTHTHTHTHTHTYTHTRGGMRRRRRPPHSPGFFSIAA